MHLLKRVIYSERVARIGRLFGMSEPLKNIYYRLRVPSDRVVKVVLWGVASSFYVPTLTELRWVETFPFGGENMLGLLVSTLRPGDVFWDVGAHIGEYTIPIAKVVGPTGAVVAFEPAEHHFGCLRKNVELNRLANVRLFHVGLGDKRAKANLLVGEDRIVEPSRNIAASNSPDKDGRYEAVELIEGDAISKVERLPAPRAVKIDVEGYEHAVLVGLNNLLSGDSCRLLCCEIHPLLLPPPIDSKTVLDRIRSLGFVRIECSPRRTEVHAVAHK